MNGLAPLAWPAGDGVEPRAAGGGAAPVDPPCAAAPPHTGTVAGASGGAATSAGGAWGGASLAGAAPEATSAEPAATGAPAAPPTAALLARLVPVAAIERDPNQPRSVWSEERLASLAASIRAAGVIQPLVVRPHPDPDARLYTPYMLIAGERRWLAARRAGLKEVPVVVRAEPLPTADRLMLQIDENDPELSETLPLFDLACAVARAFQLARCTQVRFAQRYRRSQSWVSQLLTLARTEGTAREALAENRLHGVLAARTFLRLPPAQQRQLLAEARRDGVAISLRRAERAAAHVELRRAQREAIAAERERRLAERERDGAGPAGRAGDAATHEPRGEEDGDSTAPAGGSQPFGPDDEPAGDEIERSLAWARPEPRPAVRRPLAAGALVAVELTAAQLETLLILLGQEPRGSPPEQIDQLFACL